LSTLSADTSTKPYLIRALHEWCTDQGFTPYLAVAVDETTLVPRAYVKAGEIVLNISSVATNRLSLGNDFVEFEARFGGVPQQISIPISNVSAIFAKENGHGMAFDVPKALAEQPKPDHGPNEPEQGGQDDTAGDEGKVYASAPVPLKTRARTKPKLSIAGGEATDQKPDPSPPPGKSPNGKPKLTRIK
jgi:stringent starvation protein B